MRLRRLKPEDRELTFAWRDNPLLWKWCRQNGPLHWSAHLDWFQRQASDPTLCMFAIIDEAHLVGVCGLTSIDMVNRRAEFSCYIAPEYQGAGLGRLALQQLFSYGFDWLGLETIWGETFLGNPAANLFEGIGMFHEGTRRRHYYREGQWVDALLFAMTLDEYRGQPWKHSFSMV